MAALADLALLVGSIGQEGRGISRSGGHQEGFSSPEGVVFTNFAYPDQWMNSISPRWMHPANPVPPYKLSRAHLTRLGSSDLASWMSFAPRNLV